MSNLEGKDCVFISAATKENVETLRDLLYERVKAIHVDRYPYDNLLY
jgi:GTP-binding protein HflX